MQINRGLQKPGLKHCDNANDKAFIVIVKDWLHSITKRIETEKNHNDCLIKIKACVNSFQDSREITKSLASFTRTFLTTSFVPKLKNIISSLQKFRHG